MTSRKFSFVPHYRPALVRKETKRRLRSVRKMIPLGAASEERCFVTALLELSMDYLQSNVSVQEALTKKIETVIALDAATAGQPDDVKSEFLNNPSHA